MLKTEEIKAFLQNVPATHLASLYNYNMEVQVNVARDNGEKVSKVYLGKKLTAWTDGQQTWKSFRIPWNADSIPTYEDKQMTFSLSDHVEGIGMTGWNWFNRESLWVGYDFDSIANHKEGLSQESLDQLVSKVSAVEWITLVKSTSGKGYHLYIHFEKPVKTENHTQHAALARSLLGVLTIETGFDFKTSVDVCGGILWCYHRKQEGTDGLTLLKQGSKFPLKLIPANWLDHINVVSKRTKRVRTDKISNGLDSLVASQPFILLDEEHHRLLKWFSEKADKDYWWDSDHNMFVCHTFDLLKAHTELKLKGIFHTNSSGSSTQNCFMFPNSNGSWVVRRHGIGVKEHPSWVTDGGGWTRCVFNAPAEIDSAARSNKGCRNSKGEFVFNNYLDGLRAIEHMGLSLDYPEELRSDRVLSLKVKSDLLIITVDRRPSDSIPEGWLIKGNDKFETILDLPKIKREIVAPDALIRHTVSQGVESGWYIFTRNAWTLQNKGNVQTVLVGQEMYDRNEIDVMMGKSILSPWELVNIPFAEEYMGDRQWNKEAASFKIKPSEGECNTWLEVINHCGANLTDSVLQDEWCIQNGIRTGGDYLICWFASLIQRPLQPLPYLFFVGAQGTGKSTLHEAFGAYILHRGYSRADQALVNPSGFNNEIANAVLCIVEETDLRQNKEAANRIKDWVTGKTISIRALYKNTYDSINTTHWIQCANDAKYCPIIAGDTRIIVCRVDKPSSEMSKDLLFSKLEREAPAFLNLLFSIELPESTGRLAIPCLHTHEKAELEYESKSDIERFVTERCFEVKGAKIEFDLFYAKFVDSLPPDRRTYWSKQRASRDFPKTGMFCKGKFGADNTTFLGNISFDNTELPKRSYLKVNEHNGRLTEEVTK